MGSSSQDGGIGRNPSLPPTTKRKITTNLKTTNNQKCQKIKLHGTLDNQGIEETVNQTNQTGRRETGRQADREKPWQGGAPCGQGLAERTPSKAADREGGAGCMGKCDSELTVDYDRGCHSGRNSQYHTRVHWKVGLEPSK